MPKKGVNISLKGYDDIFSTEQSRAEEQQERVQEIALSELHPFEGHPFQVKDDDDMMKAVESVKDFGVLTPAIVRPDPDGGYEIISGHRRHRASELAGKETMPVTAGASHVGIYVGNGMMIHCGNPISYASIESNYWQQHFYCFGRVR